ncbi:MAG: hypothetical protein M1829_004701 [Trizodia sp. TS-e1964]|nr:MAG: hypothetical protein M1829_004701 [Trizodia sp. TS-e1964]
MSAPSIPPRPSRSQGHQPSVASANIDVPRVPPRPLGRTEHSESPPPFGFAPSPLNETSFIQNYSSRASNSTNSLSSSLPQRPPSVILPSIGQEGNEYANYVLEASKDEPSPTDNDGEEPSPLTRNISGDLHMHAPKPSLPTSSAKARITTVTRTDSSQAASVGIGKAHSQPSDKANDDKPAKARGSVGSRHSSISTERPASTQPGETEHGVSEVGQLVPMNPLAGLVQAPSPSPHTQTPYGSGIGSHSTGQLPIGRHHGRTRSGREFYGPPGSYGLHGHGVPPQDKFEKAWYDKHPEALRREELGEYGPGIGAGRARWALSSDDLNKIVQDTAQRGTGTGTTPEITSTPNEQIGYIASEEYTSRMASPRPHSSNQQKAHSNSSHTPVESSLRNTSFPVQDGNNSGNTKSAENTTPASSEDDVIHVDPSFQRIDKVTGQGVNSLDEDSGLQSRNSTDEATWIDEQGYGVPILASDEVARDKNAEFLHPAVSPQQERRSGTYDFDASTYITGYMRPGSSRSSSRPVSVHGLPPPAIIRYGSEYDRDEMGTPLEDVNEYEPLFPEESEPHGKPVSEVDALKLSEYSKRRFPSEDIWEDSPDSAQLHTEVSQPQLPEDDVVTIKDTENASSATPSENNYRASENEDEGSFLDLAKPHHSKSHDDPLPNKQRFPSKDIWEDSPDSLQLETTVSTLQIDDIKSPASANEKGVTESSEGPQEYVAENRKFQQIDERATPQNEKPGLPARPVKTTKGADPTKEGSLPSVPARPPNRLRQLPPPSSNLDGTDSPGQIFRSQADEESRPSPTEAKAPGIPGRPKPQIPSRPARLVSRDSSDGALLTKSTSTTSATSADSNSETADGAKETSAPPITKPKPPMPPRAMGAKLAALKAGFMSDLDKRLQLGPLAPKPIAKAENDAEELERAPLVDARKGRAKGPARRKPAAPAATIPEAAEGKVDAPKLEISVPATVWQTVGDGSVAIPSARAD